MTAERITSGFQTVIGKDRIYTELFGRAGQSFFGKVDESGEAIKPRRDDQQVWGTDEDPHLTIATDSVRLTLAEKREKSAKLKAERQQEQARRESDPAFQKRQADLKRYAELLRAISGSVENSGVTRVIT